MNIPVLQIYKIYIICLYLGIKIHTNTYIEILHSYSYLTVCINECQYKFDFMNANVNIFSSYIFIFTNCVCVCVATRMCVFFYKLGIVFCQAIMYGKELVTADEPTHCSERHHEKISARHNALKTLKKLQQTIN